jgi:hypothetical protein
VPSAGLGKTGDGSVNHSMPIADRSDALLSDDVGGGLIQLGRLLTNVAIVSDPSDAQ